MKLTHENETETWRIGRLVDLVSALKAGNEGAAVFDIIDGLHDHKGTLTIIFRDGLTFDVRDGWFEYISNVWDVMFAEPHTQLGKPE